MKKIMKSITSAFMIIVIFALSMVTTFAANDPVQGKSYSYSETGNCTVNYGGEIYYSASYLSTRQFTINGNAATCSWAANRTPEAKTYYNTTKYYIGNSSLRAKAFYWLIVSPDSSIPANARYNSSSTTYQQDLAKATNAAHSGSTQTYAFAHCVIDYLQQGQANPSCDPGWNNVVVAFAQKVSNYPTVPSAYKIYYMYPYGTARQSLMSYDSPGYIQITKRSAHPNWTQGNSNYSITGAVFTVYSDQACTNTVTTITCNTQIDLDETVTINATGQTVTKVAARGKSGVIAPGTYYIKETTAPAGFRLNTDVFSVTVKAGETATKLTNLTSGAVTSSVSDEVDLGSAKLIKTSSNPSVTSNNSDYSLSGAVYVIYYDAACTRQYKTMTTNDSGIATASDLVPSTYYVKERTAPKGFELDTTVHSITVRANETAVLNLSDEPSFVPPPPEGYVIIRKQSSSMKITMNKKTYSLEGAVYGIYTNRACTNKVGEVETDSNGEGLSALLPVGTYYVKEIRASKGYQLDPTVYTATVTETNDRFCHVSEVPYTQQLDILLQKQATMNSQSQTTTSISGAQYTVTYYDDYLDNEDEVNEATPFRTWVLQTDNDGQIKLDSDHLVSGGAFFRDSSGNNVLPLGTITIKETAAPDRYYLDETLYIRKITKDGAEGITLYNVPVSLDYEIPNITISGEKVWDDDNNRDGKRPSSVTVQLYRDNELIDTATMNEANNWTYSFTGLAKGYADYFLEGGFHLYEYEVRESAVQGYTSSTESLSADPNDVNHYICNFANAYTPEKVTLKGSKSWVDFLNILGRRPQSISVILYRDGVRFQTKTVAAADNWQYEFTDLYKYHDGGQLYVYTVGEKAVTGYTTSVNGNNITNTLQTGQITIIKTDANDVPMSGVKFRLYSRDIESDGVVCTKSGGKYHFKSFTYSGTGYRVYTTDANGKIVIDGLPYGNYKIVEESTKDGYMIYDKPINVTLDYHNTNISVTAEVENAKAVLPETGGSGDGMFIVFSAILAVLGALLVRTATSKKTNNMKG